MTPGDYGSVLMGFGGSTIRRQRCPQRAWATTTWVLIAGFLLQPILSYLVTPIVAHDSQGNQIVVCTLKGQKVISVHIPQLADNADTEHCSALKLYQMAGFAQVSEPPILPAVILYSVELLDQTALHAHRVLHFSAYATRAPPIV